MSVSEVSDAIAHVGARSFPEDSSDLTGLALEWLLLWGVGEQAGPAHWEGSRLDEIVRPGGSALSVQPGGQLELSSQRHAGLAALCSAVSADVRALSDGVAMPEGSCSASACCRTGPPATGSRPRYDVMVENEDLQCEGPRFLARAVSSSSATRTLQHDVAPRCTLALLWPTQTTALRMRSTACTWI